MTVPLIAAPSVNECEGVLAASYTRGTDTTITLSDGAIFPNPTPLGHVARISSGDKFALIVYDDKTDADTLSMDAATDYAKAVNLGGGAVAAEVFPIGSTVELVCAADEIEQLFTDKMDDLVDDTAPQLGGNLDFNEFSASIDDTLTSDHTASGLIVSAPVGETVVFGETLYFDCSEVEWKLSDADVIGTMPVQGMALEGKANGEVCKILLYGFVRDDSWSWTIDDTKKVLYASVTPGDMSETAVAAADDYSQVVAIIRTATTIFFNPSLALVQHA